MPTTAPPLAPLPTFRDWLAQHATADTAIGDLARDAARDPHWQGDCPDSLRRSMARHSFTCWSAYEALAEAACFWRLDRADAIDALLAQLDEQDG